MAGESPNRRARARRERQPNVPGGRGNRTVVKLSDEEAEALTARAVAAGVSVPRLLVETTLSAEPAEAGRAQAVLALLDLDDQVRRIGANLNQLTRYAHQQRELPVELDTALIAATRACLSLDATARWVMGMSAAVSAVSIADEELAVALDDGGEWAARIERDR